LAALCKNLGPGTDIDNGKENRIEINNKIIGGT
jgi:hypothetical protein